MHKSGKQNIAIMSSSRSFPSINSILETSLKYILLLANFLIICDAIFLLIKEKDSYQGEFIEGRHPVSNYLILMLYLDIQSFLMILIGVLGIIGLSSIYCVSFHSN